MTNMLGFLHAIMQLCPLWRHSDYYKYLFKDVYQFIPIVNPRFTKMFTRSIVQLSKRNEF